MTGLIFNKKYFVGHRENDFIAGSIHAYNLSRQRYHFHRYNVVKNASFSTTSPPCPTGTFIRNVEKSDMESYKRALALLDLGTLQQLTATQLIEGIELVMPSPNTISLRFLTVVPFFKVTETYNLGGSSIIPRRDLRGGGQRASARLSPLDGTLTLQSSWGPPNAGNLEETLRLIEDDGGDTVLEYVSTLTVQSKTEVTRQVFIKTSSWTPKYTWNPLKALQIMAKNKD